MSLNRKQFSDIAKYNFGGITPPTGDPKKKEKSAKDKLADARDRNTLEWLKANPNEAYADKKLRYYGPSDVKFSGKYNEDKPDVYDNVNFIMPGSGTHQPEGVIDTGDLDTWPIFTVRDKSGNTQTKVFNKKFEDNYGHIYFTGYGPKKQKVYGWGKAPQKEDGGQVLELELTDDEIAEYEKGGYVVEEYPDGGEHGGGIYSNADVNKLGSKGVVGDVPMYVDEDGNARVSPRGGVYSGGKKKGQLREGVYNQPIDYRKVAEDIDDNVKGQFFAPVDASKSKPKWVKKLHKLPEEKRRDVTRDMDTYDFLYRKENNIPLGTDTDISREDIYNQVKKKSVKKDLHSFQKEQEEFSGTIKQGKEKKPLTFAENIQKYGDRTWDVLAHMPDFLQASVNGEASDLWANTDMTWAEQLEAHKQMGTEATIHGRERSMVGKAVNQYNPARFFDDSIKNVKEGRYGSLAADAISTLGPLKIKGAGNIINNGLRYEAGKATEGLQGLKTAFTQAGKTNPLRTAYDLGSNALKTTYHGGKLTAFPGLAKTFVDKGVKASNDEFVMGDAVDLSSKAINFYNPFKQITGGSSAAQFAFREGKDLYKAGTKLYKGLMKNDDKAMTQAGLTALSTIIPDKGIRKYGLKLSKDYAAPWLNKNVIHPIVSSTEEFFNPKKQLVVDSRINNTKSNPTFTPIDTQTFATGGEVMELTDKQIEEYRKKGFVVVIDK